jgi:hypothetical protein
MSAVRWALSWRWHLSWRIYVGLHYGIPIVWPERIRFWLERAK